MAEGLVAFGPGNSIDNQDASANFDNDAARFTVTTRISLQPVARELAITYTDPHRH